MPRFPQKLRLTFASVEELSLLPPTPRVAGRLLLALSRQTVNQSLRELEVRGCIKRNRASIEVVDDGQLRRVFDGG